MRKLRNQPIHLSPTTSFVREGRRMVRKDGVDAQVPPQSRVHHSDDGLDREPRVRRDGLD